MKGEARMFEPRPRWKALLCIESRARDTDDVCKASYSNCARGRMSSWNS